jgi:hypothetical protein
VEAAKCRQKLASAVDVSSSVDAAEDALQRGGLAAALVAPEVVADVFASPDPVALAVYEWSGRYNQKLLVDWRVIRTLPDLQAVSAIVAMSDRSHNVFPTAMGHALGYGAILLARGPDCLFAALDMAGDGENNDGFGPEQAYREFPFDGVVVNGLVVNGATHDAEIELVEYYRREVLHGPGAFLEIADGFDDYERAMRRKLERELRPRILGAAGGGEDAG